MTIVNPAIRSLICIIIRFWSTIVIMKAYLLNMLPVCIGKEVYTKTLRDMLEKNGGFQPCNKRDELYPACSIFGMVFGKEGCHDAVDSRVRFADVVLKTPFQKDVRSNYMDELVLPESGEPRPGAVEFYTIPLYKDENAKTAGWTANGYWTYDYLCVIEKGKARRKDLEENLPKIRDVKSTGIAVIGRTMQMIISWII